MKRNLNINWESEVKAIDFLCEKWKCEHTYLGKDMFSRIDGIFTQDGDIKGIYEVKCRTQGLSWFKDYKSAMISYSKLQIGSDVSRLLKVKHFVVIETGDKHLIVFQITDEEGKIVCPMNIRFNEAEKTPNFDKKASTSAYLSLDDNKYCWVIKKEFI